MNDRPAATGPKQVIVDFDNTMGIPGCDVDDGLALLFLLGHPESATVSAVTTTYGNNHLETVDANTRAIFAELGLGVPVISGCPDAGYPVGEACEFLAAAAAARPGEISLLATGSLTNLRGASLLDPAFLGNLREVVVMGGITQTLIFNGVIMDELNLSCDPVAAGLVMAGAPHFSVATANNCLPAFFDAEGFEQRFGPTVDDPGAAFLWSKCALWLEDTRLRYGLDGFHCWDVVAAVYLIMPELFLDNMCDVTLSRRLLSVGYLEPAFPGAPHARINQPVIRDADEFIQTVYAGWKRGLHHTHKPDGTTTASGGNV